jgi:hypothetical protein
VYSTHSETSDCKSPGQCCDTIPYDGFISIVSYIYIVTETTVPGGLPRYK